MGKNIPSVRTPIIIFHASSELIRIPHQSTRFRSGCVFFTRRREKRAALRLQANGGGVSAEHKIAEVKRVDHALGQGDFAPEMLMLLARAFARAELDPTRSLQEAMVSAMEARSYLGPTASSAEEISDHFAELAA